MWRVYVISGLIACVVAAVTAYVTLRLALPGGSTHSDMEIFEQSGPFSSAGGEGEINYPVPYASPPNVKLDILGSTTVVVEVKTTGFKWKDVGSAPGTAAGTWRAKGVKATKLP